MATCSALLTRLAFRLLLLVVLAATDGVAPLSGSSSELRQLWDTTVSMFAYLTMQNGIEE